MVLSPSRLVTLRVELSARQANQVGTFPFLARAGMTTVTMGCPAAATPCGQRRRRPVDSRGTWHTALAATLLLLLAAVGWGPRASDAARSHPEALLAPPPDDNNEKQSNGQPESRRACEVARCKCDTW